MRINIYNFLVNKHPGIQYRYHRIHDNATGLKKALSWLYLLWLNLAYYLLFCKFLGEKPGAAIYEEKSIMADKPESTYSPRIEEYIERLSKFDCISFDIFDTLILRPFSEPTDVFYFVGEKLGYMDFKRIRMEAEGLARHEKYKKEHHYEVTLKEIWDKMEELTGLSAEEGMALEQEAELRFCYANPFMAEVFSRLKELGKEIIIVSDMYLSKEFLARLLEAKGYFGWSRFYVSCEYGKNKGTGQLFALVKDELHLNRGKVVHVGDNENSDVKKAAEQGFATCYYPNVNKNTLLYRPYDMSPIIGGAYRGVVNNHLYCGMNRHSIEYEYGYIYGGLFVTGYCNFIHEYCKKNQVDKILFLSRDGDILQQAYNMIYPEEKTEYVYWSRKAATKLMASSDRYDYFRRFLFHKANQNITIEKIFKSMELEELIDLLPSNIGATQLLTTSNVKEVKAFLVEHWQQVLGCYESEHLAARAYYKQALQGCKRVVAVDIGWAGSGAIALNHLVNKVWNLSCDVIGLLAGTNTVYNIESDASETFLATGVLVSYLYSMSHNRDLMKRHDLNKDFNVYWELLLSSPQRQFVGFDWQDGQVQFRFGDYDANLKGIQEVQAGILQFVKEYLSQFGEIPYMLQISGRDAYAPMLVATGNNCKYLRTIKSRFDLVVGVE